MKTFYSFLHEAKDQLDISIQAAKKFLTSDKKKDWFLDTPVIVEHKTDGVKLTLIYKDDTGDYTKDWIVSYKGQIQFPEEFDFAASSTIKKSSIANAQFKLVFDHLKKITPSFHGKINTEYFIEFLMTKPTLSSNYKYKHRMVLIAHSPTTYEDNFGILKSHPTSFITNDRNAVAKELQVDHPQLLFKGTLRNFEKGIQNPELKKIYQNYKNIIDFHDNDNLIQNITDMFLKVESKYGGVEEGVVLNYGDKLLKIQQVYQVDQEARKAIKAKYQEDTEELENQYWDSIRLTALNIIKKITKGKAVKYVNFPKVLEQCAKELGSIRTFDFSHSKKNNTQIKDDIQGNIKMIIRKGLKGNNNFLFLGKFRVLTKAHYDIIKAGLRKYDGGVVAIITNKDTKDTKDLRTKMVQKAFPKIEIVHHSTGNLFSIMQKATKNINVVLAGSDRVSSYKAILKRNPDISVEETKRTKFDISATKVIDNIDSKLSFETSTPKVIHSMYNEIRRAYS